ncbi:uncharacterized protein TNCT_332021 [Trichonephila clavata]|uniref:Uncharacterized protein n=1 Tax=Trichonephila clavata TaxID=2740835 RepID=A0A8X6J5Q6_TRICU|nr:uncharacterized protein TNCT_332021 [Trichonephila clavata]
MEMFGNMPKPPMPMPDSMAAAEKEAEQMKEVADENDMTDEQFYRCFSQVNCELGSQAKKDVFDCYNVPNKEEQMEYAGWFKECPVGEFTQYDVHSVNDVFCKMNEKDQRTLNEFFLDKGKFNVKDICQNPANRQKCMRIKDGGVSVICFVSYNNLKRALMKDGLKRYFLFSDLKY